MAGLKPQVIWRLAGTSPPPGNGFLVEAQNESQRNLTGRRPGPCNHEDKTKQERLFVPAQIAGWGIHALVHGRELSDEYSATSREMSTAMYSVPVIASVIASVRAPFVSGVMSP